MNFLDVRTVVFSQMLTNAVSAAVLAFLWGQNRKCFAGTADGLSDLAFQERRMIELQSELNALLKESGQPEKYRIAA